MIGREFMPPSVATRRLGHLKPNMFHLSLTRLDRSLVIVVLTK